MEQSLELLKQINWFLKPVSDFLLYFVVNPTGRVLLIIGFLIYFVSTYAHSVKMRRLAGRGSSAYGSGFVPFGERIYLFIRDFFRPMLKIIIHFPVVLGVIVALSMLVGISAALQSTQQYFENQQRIEELSTVVKQLDKRYKVAELEIKAVDYVAGLTTLNISYYKNGKLQADANQKIEIKGLDIYFDAVVLNFDYSSIARGEKHNLVLPYRVFSERVPAEKGKKLYFLGKDSIPVFFEKETKQIYGVDPEKYTERVKELMRFVKDKDFARKMGVRSFLGTAVHKRVYPGTKYEVWAEQTGGLVLKPKSRLF